MLYATPGCSIFHRRHAADYIPYRKSARPRRVAESMRSRVGRKQIRVVEW